MEQETEVGIHEISVSRGRKVNLGNYETESISITMTQSLTSADSITIRGLRTKLNALAEEFLDGEELSLRRKLKKPA